MARLFITLATLVLLATTAYAQPALHLTSDERELLVTGEISDGTTTAAGVTSIFVGLGVGQAIEGRYWKTGWMFTLGDLAATGLIMGGTMQLFSYDCDASCRRRADAIFIAGGIVALGVRIAEVYDAFNAPKKHNRRVRELRMRLGAPTTVHVTPYIVPLDPSGNAGASAGLTLAW